MGYCILLQLSCVLAMTAAWSAPFYPVSRAPLRVTRFAPHPHLHPHPHFHPHPQRPHHRIVPRPEHDEVDETEVPRPKRDHDDDDDYGRDYDHDHDHRSHVHGHRNRGVTGPIHTFVKTDKNANYKWGVRHHVGNKYAE